MSIYQSLIAYRVKSDHHSLAAMGVPVGGVVVADEVLGFGAVFEPVGLGFGGGGVTVVGVDFEDGAVS